MVAAVVVGAALAAAGAITQTVARNPLASPDLLGVTAGASLGAVTVLVVAGGGHAGLSGLAATVGMPVAAFTAGIVSGVAVYLLAYRRGLDSYRLVLAGLGISGPRRQPDHLDPDPGRCHQRRPGPDLDDRLAQRQGLGHSAADGRQRGRAHRRGASSAAAGSC